MVVRLVSDVTLPRTRGLDQTTTNTPHSHTAMAETAPTDDKAHYETVKKELLQALPKKRAIDKQLVRD